MDRRRGAKIAYIKEKRLSREVPATQKKIAEQPKKQLNRSDKFLEREQLHEKRKNSGWRLNDLRANKNGFRHDVFWVSGDLYRGNWKLNKKEGSGIHSYSTGNRYEGDWKNNKRDGYGTLYLREDGKYRVVYKGHWKANRLHGPGYLHCAYGEAYEGDFEDGLRSGHGKQTYWCPKSRSYHVYVGQWRGDKREGQGRLNLINGDVYEGGFSNDMKHGPGVFFYMTTSCKFHGLWRNDVAVSGTYTKLDPLEPLPLPPFQLCYSLPPLEVIPEKK